MLTIEGVLERLREEFKKALQAKTGWGRNEIITVFDDVMDYLESGISAEQLSWHSDMICHRSMGGLEVLKCRTDCMMYNHGSGRCRENEFVDLTLRRNSNNSSLPSLDDDLPF